MDARRSLPGGSLGSLRADVVSGAAVVARAATRIVERVAARLECADEEEFRARMEELVHDILDAQPSMAPLVTLSARVLEALGESLPLPDLRRAVVRAAGALREELDAGTVAAARHAAELLPQGGRILTLSASSTVRAALLAFHQEKGGHALCLESRPMNEGASMARGLAAAGVPVTLAVDAAGDLLARSVDAVLLGADSVGDEGIVNKIGSRAVAGAAAEAGVPVFVVTDRSKFLPPGVPGVPAPDRPGEEVSPPSPGLRIWNRYFEPIPLELVSAVVTREGALSPEQVLEVRRGLVLPPALERWIRRREERGKRSSSGRGP